MSVNKSFRFPEALSERLDNIAARLARKPNWIVTRAVDEYLRKFESGGRRREAARQCRRANHADKHDNWESFGEF